MDTAEALWWDAQLKLNTWPARTDPGNGQLIPAGMPPERDPRDVVNSLVAARREKVAQDDVDLGRLDDGIAKAEQAVKDLQAARERQAAERDADQADLDRCIQVRDLFLATLAPADAAMGFGAHNATISTEA